MSRTRVLIGLIAVATVGFAGRAASAQFINDSFSTFSDGNLVGQNGWTQLGASATVPIQVAAGQVIIPAIAPGGPTADNQDANKAFTTVVAPAVGTTSVFVGLNMAVNQSFTSPSPGSGTPTPSYFLALLDTAGGGFANSRVTAKDDGTGTGYLLGARVTGQAGYPFAFGTTSLAYNTFYQVVLQFDMVAGAQNDNVKLYINPTQPTDPVYVMTLPGTGTDPSQFDHVILSQFASSTVFQDGVTINSLRVNTDFFAVIPEPATVILLAAGGLAALRRRR